MVNIVVNGRSIELKEGTTVENMLKNLDFTLTRVAVEINGLIIDKKRYATHQLKDHDQIEVVSFVAGG